MQSKLSAQLLFLLSFQGSPDVQNGSGAFLLPRGLEMNDHVLIPALWSKQDRQIRAVTYRIDDDCFLCTSHRPNDQGYPRIMIDGQRFSIPRLVCLLFNGPGGNNDVVMHNCDNPMCINPAHLRMGTQVENMKGCKERGRTTVGEKHAQAKLRKEDVKAIRQLGGSATQQQIANIYSISRSQIGRIINHGNWKHVA